MRVSGDCSALKLLVDSKEPRATLILENKTDLTEVEGISNSTSSCRVL